MTAPGDHERWMRAALDAARRGADRGEVPIGAVIVDRAGAVVAEGCNRGRSTGDRTAHAEIVALRAASVIAGAPPPESWTLVTTLEPCRMCLGAAIELGLERVVYALDAPSNGAVGAIDGEDRLSIIGGVLGAESLELLQAWLRSKPEGRGVAFVRDLVSATIDR